MSSAALKPLQPAFGLAFEDLYEYAGLARLDAAFMDWVARADGGMQARLAELRANAYGLAYKAEAEFLIALAPHVDAFIAHLFDIEPEWDALNRAHHRLAPLFRVKRKFVQRRAMLKIKADAAEALDGPALEREVAALLGGAFDELAFAEAILAWQADEPAHAKELAVAEQFAAWAAHTVEGQRRYRHGVLFKPPQRVDPMNLVPVQTDASRGYSVHTLHDLRPREGFQLTDPGTDLAGALDEANYCIWCHEQGKDSCSKGLRDKPLDDGTAPFKKTVFGVPLNGCPLEERISEFHKLKTEGWAVGALAMIVIDNPTVCGTGHRICNDCMKSCIYQRQTPVDIPQAETRTLKDVLGLPWGFEIYSLLTRWNPLNLRRPLPLEPTGKRVLVVGMGPAGFTLAHHLMNDGHTVVGIDGLKIEPIDARISGVEPDGKRVPFQPIRDFDELREPLESRVMAGFGGVAEYGITVRWDKNFLKVARLLVERRSQFSLFGGVRFGGTISTEDAFALGFDHVALAMGAGKPTVLDMPNGLVRGVRTASDFLMALQLTGAAREESIANLQVRLPIVVIGGGLTAIDTATESLAYYAVQVEKFLARYEKLVAERSAGEVRNEWSEEETEIAEEYLTHATALRAEREKAAEEGRPARIQQTLQAWGGVTIAYRKRLIDSPSYTLNHEEVAHALHEGVRFAEGLTPVAVEVDRFGAARALVAEAYLVQASGDALKERVELTARTILVAAGTQPNTVLAREEPEEFMLDGRYFQAIDDDGNLVEPERSAKPARPQVLVARDAEDRYVSFFGDLHPSFAGNVVKAMGSAKQGYPVVSRVLARRPVRSVEENSKFLDLLNAQLRARVERVERLTSNIVEVVVRAPMAARKFRPGQFFRLQNYEMLAAKPEGTRLAMEGLALTGAWVDRDAGLVSTIVLEMGGSSDLCALLTPGEPVVLMGPTGTATHVPGGETVVLVGGGLGNAVLFSIGAALRKNGSKVLYFAGYKKMRDRYKVAEIEAAADEVVWCSDEAPGFEASRAGDKAFVGNIVEAMAAHATGALGVASIRMQDADRIIAIGSDGMMAAVARARHGVLAPHLKPSHVGIGSINSPMQCMMKEICAQCLQPHVDPRTGVTRYVFSCFNQDQLLDLVDFGGLRQRLAQNGVQEKLTAHWIDHVLVADGARPRS
ncbi:MAG TPA: FAD-dependent oxidoreductase [Usitatibacter sp.]|jgi:NADPH-dependent glutamate synthase beta subunit-like oxidoreductase/NAD(P)H-flavin reductase|nr:FAD-dependent oxidoreductase [Usitatibacter sp.]